MADVATASVRPRPRAPLLHAAARWDDSHMSENEDQELASPAVGHENPTTHQMRIVGQRRTEAEAKLERQQREAREKLHEE
ncbi:hypothetical protein GCM10027405_00480 [Arthrobacter alkaliphilus]